MGLAWWFELGALRPSVVKTKLRTAGWGAPPTNTILAGAARERRKETEKVD